MGQKCKYKTNVNYDGKCVYIRLYFEKDITSQHIHKGDLSSKSYWLAYIRDAFLENSTVLSVGTHLEHPYEWSDIFIGLTVVTSYTGSVRPFNFYDQLVANLKPIFELDEYLNVRARWAENRKTRLRANLFFKYSYPDQDLFNTLPMQCWDAILSYETVDCMLPYYNPNKEIQVPKMYEDVVSHFFWRVFLSKHDKIRYRRQFGSLGVYKDATCESQFIKLLKQKTHSKILEKMRSI